MVGLVVVSHSRALAEGVAHLVNGVNEIAVPLAYAGGAGEDHGELGTDATDIMEAIQQVDSPDGVLVLMDLGSAVLSAETALEFLEGMLSGPVRLVPAPLVEGAVSAAVQIALESDLDTVVREALDALAPKQEQLSGTGPDAGTSPAGASDDGQDAATLSDADADADALEASFLVETAHGLHARPAANLVRTVGRYRADAQVQRVGGDGRWANARSLNRIATLQVRNGDRFVLRARGDDARELLDAVRSLVDDNFGEARVSAAPSGEGGPRDLPSENASSGVTVLRLARDTRSQESERHDSGPQEPLSAHGVAAAPGLALAPVHLMGHATVHVDTSKPVQRAQPLKDDAVAQLMEPLVSAREALAAELREESHRARSARREDAAEIAEAHETLLMDPELDHTTRSVLASRDVTAAEAFWIAAEEQIHAYRAIDDAYLRARAADVEDVARRLLSRVAPERVTEPELPRESAILAADDLLPSQTMRLDPSIVRGVVTARGSAASHAAIIARGLGIPMVAGVRIDLDGTSGVEAIVDGDAGTVELAPSTARRDEVTGLIAERTERREKERRAASRPGALSDGTTLPIMANVATAADAESAVGNGADGVGLLRTEFMFLGADHLPDETEQREALLPMMGPFDARPITVRLLDIGGDKEVASWDLPREANPFLGVRGVRLLLADENRERFHHHLRAVLTAAAGRNAKIMIPMVARVEEVRRVKRELSNVHGTLDAEGVEHAWPIQVGIMVETPAAALRAADLAAECDFFSLGTNDLTQYVMAAERGNAAVADLSDGLHPAVLDAVRLTVDAAREAGVPVSVCGELASDVHAVPILIGLGVHALSVNPAAVAHTKAVVRSLSMEDCADRAQRALRCVSAEEVRALAP